MDIPGVGISGEGAYHKVLSRRGWKSVNVGRFIQCPECGSLVAGLPKFRLLGRAWAAHEIHADWHDRVSETEELLDLALEALAQLGHRIDPSEGRTDGKYPEAAVDPGRPDES